MIKVKKNDNLIIISGHANYDIYGKDIVCASVSSIIITSINASLRIDKEAIRYEQVKDKLTIEILKQDEIVLEILDNMLDMLKELALTYKKNIKVEEERA